MHCGYYVKLATLTKITGQYDQQTRIQQNPGMYWEDRFDKEIQLPRMVND